MQNNHLRTKSFENLKNIVQNCQRNFLKSWHKSKLKQQNFTGTNSNQFKFKKSIYLKNMTILIGLKGCLKYSLVKINNQWLQLPLDQYCHPGSTTPAIFIILLTIQIPVRVFSTGFSCGTCSSHDALIVSWDHTPQERSKETGWCHRKKIE